MQHSAEMHRCIEQLDTVGARRLAAHVWPHLPQPRTDAETLIQLHIARTQLATLAFKLRAYSHCWLAERGLLTMLPDELRPKAERMYPRVQDCVGIACGGSSDIGRAIAPIVRGAMEDAVSDCYANNDREPVLVKGRMMEARHSTVKKLLGSVASLYSGRRH